jgi:hypothetical protein
MICSHPRSVCGSAHVVMLSLEKLKPTLMSVKSALCPFFRKSNSSSALGSRSNRIDCTHTLNARISTDLAGLNAFRQ